MFLAGVVAVDAARPVFESVLRVTDARGTVFRITLRPRRVCRRVSVVPLDGTSRRGGLFVQSEPVVICIQLISALTAHNAHAKDIHPRRNVS